MGGDFRPCPRGRTSCSWKALAPSLPPVLQTSGEAGGGRDTCWTLNKAVPRRAVAAQPRDGTLPPGLPRPEADIFLRTCVPRTPARLSMATRMKVALTSGEAGKGSGGRDEAEAAARTAGWATASTSPPNCPGHQGFGRSAVGASPSPGPRSDWRLRGPPLPGPGDPAGKGSWVLTFEGRGTAHLHKAR